MNVYACVILETRTCYRASDSSPKLDGIVYLFCYILHAPVWNNSSFVFVYGKYFSFALMIVNYLKF